jgi:hypothetical protein
MFELRNPFGQDLVKAHLEVVSPTIDNPIVPFHFNPTEYQIQKGNTFAEIPIPGLESPPIQFIRGASEKLSADLLLDTSDTLEDVRIVYVDRLREMMRLSEELHAPPIVNFVWDSAIFKGVVESLGITYTLFTQEGVPIRAKVALALKEYRPVEVQVRRPVASPDFDKTWVVKRGDTLSGIASLVYRDPAVWRSIARANEIIDPRSLEVGRRLLLPRLR